MPKEKLVAGANLNGAGFVSRGTSSGGPWA